MAAVLVLCVALGGFVGAPARLLLDRFIADRFESELPLGTFAINVSGSFLLGYLSGLALAGDMPDPLGALLGTGFCGAFTTFSTWSFETVRLIENGDLLEATMNAIASLVVGLAACAAGIALGLLA
jgi:CrcB protein